MRVSRMYALSAAAGLAVLVGQNADLYHYVASFIDGNEKYSIDFVYRIIFAVISVLLTVFAVSVADMLGKSRSIVKYADLSNEINKIVTRRLLSNTQQENVSDVISTQVKIDHLLGDLVSALEHSLEGNRFSVSIMLVVNDKENSQEFLKILYCKQTNNVPMIASIRKIVFVKGEGFCGNAWSCAATQTGNNCRTLPFFMKDFRWIHKTADDDINKSYAAVPLLDNSDSEKDVIGILNIDSDNVNDFPRHKEYAMHLNMIMTPILALVNQNLTNIADDEP